MKRLKKWFYLVLGIGVLGLAFLLSGVLINIKSKSVIYTAFSPYRYQVISSSRDETEFQSGIRALDDASLSCITSVDSSQNQIHASKTAKDYFEKGQGYILPPNNSYPFGLGFRVDNVVQKDGETTVAYKELAGEEAIKNKIFNGVMAVDMNSFVPAYDISAEESDAEFMVIGDMMRNQSTESQLLTDSEGFISIDLEKIKDSECRGTLQLRISTAEIDCDLASLTCTVKMNTDYVLNASFDKKIKKDILIGTVYTGIGKDGLAGVFINIYLCPSASGEAAISARGVIASGFGSNAGEWDNSLNEEVYGARPEIKDASSVLLGVRSEIRVLSNRILYGDISGGAGFDVTPMNSSKCYDISGYLLLSGGYGSDGWFNRTNLKPVELNVYDKYNALQESLVFHFETENGFVSVCSYLTDEDILPVSTPAPEETTAPMETSVPMLMATEPVVQSKTEENVTYDSAPKWKDAYYRFLEELLPERLNTTYSEDGVELAFTDINSDGIPELVEYRYVGGASYDGEIIVYHYSSNAIRQLGTAPLGGDNPDRGMLNLARYRRTSTGETVFISQGNFGGLSFFNENTTLWGGSSGNLCCNSLNMWGSYDKGELQDLLAGGVECYFNSENDGSDNYFVYAVNGNYTDPESYKRTRNELWNGLSTEDWSVIWYTEGYPILDEMGLYRNKSSIYRTSRSKGMSDGKAADKVADQLFENYYASLPEGETAQGTQLTDSEDFVLQNTGTGTSDFESMILSGNSAYYKRSELTGLTKSELRLLRNGLYALSGLRFHSKDLQNYFGQFDWYRPYTENDDSVYAQFNAYQKTNLSTIRTVEKEKGY